MLSIPNHCWQLMIRRQLTVFKEKFPNNTWAQKIFVKGLLYSKNQDLDWDYRDEEVLTSITLELYGDSSMTKC